jgi:hypothetical protein
VVAARGGQVKAATRDSGAGTYVVVLGDDGIWYWYLHLARGSVTVARDQWVRAGQRIGTMGNTSGCTSGTTATHLHFEMRFPYPNDAAEMGKEYEGPRDPYPSVKARFTRPGYAAVANNNAQTPYGLLTQAWRNAIAGDYVGRIALVGWPASSTQPDNGYVANPDWLETDGYYQRGYKQYLGNGDGGFDGRGLWRSGVLTQQAGSSTTAYWVHGLIWRRYSNMSGYASSNEEDSWLGWPTSYEFRDSRGLTRQNFEGGCIANNGSGTYVPARYGQFPCNY